MGRDGSSPSLVFLWLPCLAIKSVFRAKSRMATFARGTRPEVLKASQEEAATAAERLGALGVLGPACPSVLVKPCCNLGSVLAISEWRLVLQLSGTVRLQCLINLCKAQGVINACSGL